MDTFTPADFADYLATGAAAILPWVGAAVGAGLALMLLYAGIRKGIAFFVGTADGGPTAAEINASGAADAWDAFSEDRAMWERFNDGERSMYEGFSDFQYHRDLWRSES